MITTNTTKRPYWIVCVYERENQVVPPEVFHNYDRALKYAETMFLTSEYSVEIEDSDGNIEDI